MKNWIVAQGWSMYIMLAMAVIGIIGSIACRIIYGRLAREAQILGTSDDALMHYIRQKYASYYKLGMRPSDARAIVGRYVSLHKVGLLPLNAYRYIRVWMSGTIVLNGLTTALYRYSQLQETVSALTYLGTSVAMVIGLWLFGMLLGTDNVYRVAENAMIDYLDNYLRSKLDGEYGYVHHVEEPNNYERALRENTAGRGDPAGSKIGMSPEYNRRTSAGADLKYDRVRAQANDAVDAQIVEDVLKEFLC